MAAAMPGGYVDYWLDLAKPPSNKFLLFTSPQILSETQRKLDEVPTDPDDNKILEGSVEAGADIIISADKDLLSLKTFNGAQIFHPSNLKYIFKYLENEL